ncbi:MAG: DnaJ C-terminal domain-containing protein [Maricaulaceae bacterium]
MAKNPYKLLEIAKTASDGDIRKAYRALAKKYHPDVNPGNKTAANKFKEISAAYSLLSDKKLRSQYDNGSVDANGQAQSPFGGGFHSRGGQFQRNPFGGKSDDITDLFSSLFGMNVGEQTGGSNRRGYKQNKTPQKGKDVRYAVTLSFLEAIKGGQKRIKLADGKTLNVTIPEAVENGTALRLRGKGEAGINGGDTGDARVEITVKSHKYFSRDGDVLKLTLPITLGEAVLGAKVTVTIPAGTISLNIPAGSDGGKAFRIKNKGIKGGALIVTPQIILPRSIDKDLEIWAQSTNNMGSSNPRDVLGP